jgi:predicted nucleic acid-binding protein
VIVVADTSPLRYLILIEHDHILPALYERVLAPPAVMEELAREQTPDIVRQRLANRPEWLIIQAPTKPVAVRRSGLGPGEAAAIALALEQSADALLIDDRDARHEARDHGLIVLGTLRVLADAAEHGFADLGTALNRLKQTNFRASEFVLNELLARHRRED